MSNALAVVDNGLDQAILRAAGLDKVPEAQRTLAINIASKYGLDLMLKHLIIVDGRPYITRDGLIHVALRSGQFDGIEVTDPVLDGDYWRCRATVYRKDMSHGITYPGRYPKNGSNQKFGPEMAIKVAEVMSLRRAFDVAAPVIEERWDLDEQPAAVERAAPVPLAARVARSRAAIEARTDAPQSAAEPATGESSDGSAPVAAPDAPVAVTPAPQGPVLLPVKDEAVVAAITPAAAASSTKCDGFEPALGRCVREMGHEGNHRNKAAESWK